MIFICVHIKINVVDRHSPTHLPNTEDVFWRNVVAQTSHTKPCVLSHGLKFCVMTKTLHRSSSHVVNHSELGVQKRWLPIHVGTAEVGSGIESNRGCRSLHFALLSLSSTATTAPAYKHEWGSAGVVGQWIIEATEDLRQVAWLFSLMFTTNLVSMKSWIKRPIFLSKRNRNIN
jgi:hypothetical protein